MFFAAKFTVLILAVFRLTNFWLTVSLLFYYSWHSYTLNGKITIEYVYDHILSKNPASLKICTLLDKPSRRKAGITLQADYTGFVIPNAFVVGYGLDYNEKYRNLPYVGILKPEVYNS